MVALRKTEGSSHGRYLTLGGVIVTGVVAAGVFLAMRGGANQQAGQSPSVVRQVEASHRADADEIAVVRQVFERAMQARQSAGSPSAEYQETALAKISAGGDPQPVPAAERQRLQAEGTKELKKYFTAEAMPLASKGLQGMLEMDADAAQALNLGAGVSKVSFVSTSVSGNGATVVADVTQWAKSEVRFDGQGKWTLTYPQDVMRFQAELVRGADGVWRVKSYIGDIAPGQTP